MMSVKKKVDNKSKEEKVALITSKNTLIMGVLVAFITLVSLNLSEYIKKPSPNFASDEREILYFDNARKESNEQFTDIESNFENSIARIEGAISNEANAEKRAKYDVIKNRLQNNLVIVRTLHKSFDDKAKQSLSDLKNGDRLNAAVNRKNANEKTDLENIFLESKYIEVCEKNSFTGESKQPTFCLDYEDKLRKNNFDEVNALRRFGYEKPIIRGINNAYPKKTINDITETYASDKAKDSVTAQDKSAGGASQ